MGDESWLACWLLRKLFPVQEAGALVQHPLSASGRQRVCVGEQQPFSSMKTVQCFPKGSQRDPLLGLPTEAGES